MSKVGMQRLKPWNPKGVGIGGLFMIKIRERVLKREVRSLHEQEISENLFGNLKP
jgi:hypothetical protein